MRVIVVEDDVDFFVLRLIGQHVVEETAEAEIGGVVLVIDAKNEKSGRVVCELRCGAAARRAVISGVAAGDDGGGAQKSREIPI